MNEQKSGARKRKVIWVGVGIAALAVILVASSGIDFPPGGTNTSGAIVPAQRFRAEQPATTGVSAPGQATRNVPQGTAGNVGDARSSDARASDSLRTDGRADSLRRRRHAMPTPCRRRRPCADDSRCRRRWPTRRPTSRPPNDGRAAWPTADALNDAAALSDAVRRRWPSAATAVPRWRQPVALTTAVNAGDAVPLERRRSALAQATVANDAVRMTIVRRDGRSRRPHAQ